MKIEMELKDNPKGRPPIKITVDVAVHRKLHLYAMVAAAKKQYPWIKIIDLRIDLR